MGADRFHWGLVSDGDSATRALNADERIELDRLRRMCTALGRLHIDAIRWVTEENSPNLRAAKSRIAEILTMSGHDGDL